MPPNEQMSMTILPLEMARKVNCKRLYIIAILSKSIDVVRPCSGAGHEVIAAEA